MATISTLVLSKTDSRKEGLPLYGFMGSSGDQNEHMSFRIFDSGHKVVGTPWGQGTHSTASYRFGICGDGMHAYSHGADFGTDINHADLTTQGYDSWTNYNKSIYQTDQYPWGQYYTLSRTGYVTWQSYHQYTESLEFQIGWTKLNMVLPEGIRPRRLFCNRRQTLREMNPGNNASGQIQYYNYTTHMLSVVNDYAVSTGYNEKTQTLVMLHSANETTSTAMTIHIFKSSVCLNKVKTIKEFFDNLTATEYFTDTWTTDNNKDWVTVVGNNGYVGFGQKYSNTMNYGVFNCNTGQSLGITGAARQFSTWQAFQGSTTTSYSSNQQSLYYTKFNHTWDGTWGMIYSSYYYYGVGINAFCMNLENPRKFISVSVTRSSRGNPYFAWGRTGFHGGWSENTDSISHRTYAWSFDPNDSDHTTTTKVLYGETNAGTLVPASNDTNLASASSITSGSVVTNKTGVFSVPTSRTFLHGGYYSTNYPLMMQVNWWGNYGAGDHSYTGLYGSN
jgi:hypothetical protein